MRKSYFYFAVIGLLGTCLLMGCQAVFTFCPVSFLQRPSSTLAPEQLVPYAQDALASGDTTVMAAAYASLTATISASTTDPTVLYTAASLGLELSGAPAILTAALTGLSSGTAPDLSIADLEGISTGQIQLLMDSATYLQDAQANGAALTAVDYVLGGVGIILQQAVGSVANVASLNPAQIATATDFVLQGITDLHLPAGDPVADILNQFKTLLQTL